MSLKQRLGSPVGRKLITGITGLGLVIFVLEHMLGNLAMFASDNAYNEYAYFLESLGWILYTLEAGLVLFFVLHIVMGIRIWLGKRRARPVSYNRYESAGRPSRLGVSSKSMILTGIILAGFLVIHLISFKFGPGGPGNADPSYVTSVDGVEMRDLAKLVREKFQSPWYAFGYTAVMLLLVVHLRHGIWSALQSIGAMRPSLTPLVYGIGTLIGLAIGVGFLVLPLALYFNVL